ncbi:hypothetical protein FHS27_005414 [Rhodopirellula rubra]|uniref:Uncharacterized protein n=1 Tax=Aporhodopirellula rubra TaxID=980271 RepID=A0A7W5H8M5_9BACT|nr:hypothetical protein [Aporhodopirellula rubra]
MFPAIRTRYVQIRITHQVIMMWTSLSTIQLLDHSLPSLPQRRQDVPFTVAGFVRIQFREAWRNLFGNCFNPVRLRSRFRKFGGTPCIAVCHGCRSDGRRIPGRRVPMCMHAERCWVDARAR